LRDQFSGKTVIVTGGGGGIGAGIARAFVEHGATVVIFENSASGAQEASKLLKGNGQVFKLDVSDCDAVEKACQKICEERDGIDILVNNAGITLGKSLNTLTIEQWRKVIDVNLTGPFNCIKAVIPSMRARNAGAIVNISSLAGIKIAFNSGANYTAAKAGLLGLTRQAAMELARYNIRVNAVCPGFVLTPHVLEEASEDELPGFLEMIPLGRMATPDDVAGAVMFLSGSSSELCTGIELVIDGGLNLSFGGRYAEYFERREGLPKKRKL